MFTPSAHALPEAAPPTFLIINSMWCGDNPNVDQSAPPPKKTAKKKSVAKKAGKKR